MTWTRPLVPRETSRPVPVTSRRRWRLTGEFVNVRAVMAWTTSPDRAMLIRSLAPTLSEWLFRQIRICSKRRTVQRLNQHPNGAVDLAAGRERTALSLLAQDPHRCVRPLQKLSLSASMRFHKSRACHATVLRRKSSSGCLGLRGFIATACARLSQITVNLFA